MTDEPPRSFGPLLSVPLLGWLLVGALGLTCLYLPRFHANLDQAEVSEIVPVSSTAVVYRVLVGGCVGSLPGPPGSHVVGEQVLVRHIGCSEIRDAADNGWWTPYPVILVLLALVAAVVVLAWVRPDLIRAFIRRLSPMNQPRRQPPPRG